MSRLIDADKLKEKMMEYCTVTVCADCGGCFADLIDEQPTVLYPLVKPEPSVIV